jgi:plastocyanin
VTFTATAWAYGVAERDSIQYIINYPLWNLIFIVPLQAPVLVFSPSRIEVAAGGYISFWNYNDQPVDVVFDDSATVDSVPADVASELGAPPGQGQGNIPPFFSDPTGTDTSVFSKGVVARQFPVAGIYHIHSRLYPAMSGVIDVRPNLP